LLQRHAVVIKAWTCLHVKWDLVDTHAGVQSSSLRLIGHFQVNLG